MAWRKFPTVYLGLRVKLALVSLVLLAIPWAAYQSANEVELILRIEKEKSLLASAKALATALKAYPEHFRSQKRIHQKQDHYVHPLPAPIQIDGYVEDWYEYLERSKQYTIENTLKETTIDKHSIEFEYLLGSHKQDLYILIRVKDDKLVYRNPTQVDPFSNDHIILAIKDRNNQLKRYIIATEAPGWVQAKEIRSIETEDGPVHMIRNVGIAKGEWQNNEGGYTVELKMPLSRVNEKLAINIVDVDDAEQGKIRDIIGTSQSKTLEELGNVFIPSPSLAKLLTQLNSGQGRYMVLDKHSQVLAVQGSLQRMQAELQQQQREQEIGFFGLLIELIYSMILHQPTEDFSDNQFTLSQIDNRITQQALQGRGSTQWRASTDQQVSIVSAAQPIYINDEVSGAVLLEETSNSILSAQNLAVQRLFNIIIIGMSFAMLAIFYYTSRLSRRITRLKSQVENAINNNGQILGSIDRRPATDELGILTNSFSAMLNRLQEYTRYLETMAGKLSHELRTPLAVVKSSLENLSLEPLSPDALVYKDRAADGAQRLSTILTGLSEATRLEQALQSSEKEDFDLAAVITSCIEGYRQVYPSQTFDLQSDTAPLMVHGVPEYIAQMLDKLISNAVDFCKTGTAITVKLVKDDNWAVLKISNQGTILPKEMRERLFDSMVSMRKQKDDAPHLGLGLFIVKLISEFHLGQVSGNNLADKSGVEFFIRLPLNQNAN